MLKKTRPLLVVFLLALATGCATDSAPAPAPAVAPQTANNQAPIDPGDGGGGGSGPVECIDEAMPADVRDRVLAYVQKEVRLRRLTVVTSPDAPDGIIYGLGCNGVYVFSVNLPSTYLNGLYDNGTLSLN